MATSPILSLPTPNSSSTDQVPADLLTLITAAEGYMVGRFADASTRAALITSPIAGMVSYNVALARHEWYDGTGWRPLPGTLISNHVGTVSAVTVTNVADQAGYVSTITPATQTFPTRHEVEFGCLLTAAVADATDIAVFLNASPVRSTRQVGNGDKGGHYTLDLAASASASWQGAITKAVGTTITTVSTNASFSFFKVRVYAA